MMLRRLLAENAFLLREVAELRALRELAYQDGLTGLGNRRYLEARLDEELSRSRRGRLRHGSLLALDVDRFRDINAGHGRVIGDRALRWLARLLQDTVGERDVCCRTGANEFMLILPDTEREGAEAIAACIDDRLGQAAGFRWLPMTVSAGVASWPQDGSRLLDLVDVATRVLTAAKRGKQQPTRLHLVR
jgi:diguanylate cyclase (GGDEF)-like protein